MTSAYQVKTTVRPGNRVEISTPELRVGEAVDVIVLRQEGDEHSKRSALEILEEIHATIPPGDPHEMDRRMQEERDSWDF